VDQDCDPHRHPNLIDCSFGHAAPLQNFIEKSIKKSPDSHPDPNTDPASRQIVIDCPYVTPHNSKKINHDPLRIMFITCGDTLQNVSLRSLC